MSDISLCQHSGLVTPPHPPTSRILWNDHLFVVGQPGDKWICGSKFQGTKVSISDVVWLMLDLVCVRIWGILVQIRAWSCGVCWLGRFPPPHLWGNGDGLLLRKRRPKDQVPTTSRFHLYRPFFSNILFTSDAALHAVHGDQAPTPPPGPGGRTCCHPRRPGWPWGRRSFTRAERAEQAEQQRPTRPLAGTVLYNTHDPRTPNTSMWFRMIWKSTLDFVTIYFVFAKFLCQWILLFFSTPSIRLGFSVFILILVFFFYCFDYYTRSTSV